MVFQLRCCVMQWNVDLDDFTFVVRVNVVVTIFTFLVCSRCSAEEERSLTSTQCDFNWNTATNSFRSLATTSAWRIRTVKLADVLAAVIGWDDSGLDGVKYFISRIISTFADVDLSLSTCRTISKLWTVNTLAASPMYSSVACSPGGRFFVQILSLASFWINCMCG